MHPVGGVAETGQKRWGQENDATIYLVIFKIQSGGQICIQFIIAHATPIFVVSVILIPEQQHQFC